VIPTRGTSINPAADLIQNESITASQLQASAQKSIELIKMLFSNLITTALLGFTSLVSAADTSAWKSRSIYFVLTDRVARSSSDTGGASCSNLGNYCGGTFKGLESKIDYIKGLGFDAIWITPVVSSTVRSSTLDFMCINNNRRQGCWIPWLLG